MQSLTNGQSKLKESSEGEGSTDISNLKTTGVQVKTWTNHIGIISDSLALGFYVYEKQSTGDKDF